MRYNEIDIQVNCMVIEKYKCSHQIKEYEAPGV